MLAIKICATGKALPARCVTSAQLDRQLGKREGHVERRSGIRHRHFAAFTDSPLQLAATALRTALADGRIAPASIDLLICASAVPQQALPCSASLLLEAAGLAPGTATFDINASCLSFLAALQVAAALLQAGQYRRIAIVSSDLPSRGLDWTQEEASLIFGDGAAAIIVEQGHGTAGIQRYRLESYPEGRDFCEVRAGGTRCNPSVGINEQDFLFRMQGKRLYKLVSAQMDGFLSRLLGDWQLDDIDLVVPHQASHLGMQHMRKQLGLSEARIVDIYAEHGNQVSASLPTALHEAIRSGRAAPGSRLLLLGTAAGVILGGMVLTL